MDKENVTHTHTHTHNGKVFNHRKEENPAICDNTNGPWEHDAKRSKPDRERQTMYDLTYMWNLKRQTN